MVENIKADKVNQTLNVFIQKLNGLGGQPFKLVTSDTSSEFAMLSQLTTETDLCFCNLYFSFKRGIGEK